MILAFKNFIRDKGTVFWTFIFPIILLGIMLNMFSFENPSIKYDSENDFYNEYLKEFENLEKVETTDYKKALEDKEIDVYIDKDGTLISKSDTVYANIFKNVMDIGKRIQKDPQAATEIFKNIKETEENFDNRVNQIIFSVLMMTAFYASYGGLGVTRILNPKTSVLAQRMLISPQKTSKTLFIQSVINIILCTLPVLVATLFAVYVFGFEGINDITSTIIILATGIIYGFAFGIFIGSFSLSESKMGAIILAYMLTMSFMSGMSGESLLITIIKKAKWLLKINPLYILTKNLMLTNSGFNYSLNVNEILIILVVSAILIVVATLLLRRKKYDSI